MLRLLSRGAIGSLGIYGLTALSGFFGMALPVGVNLVTFLSCAILGLPGLLLVYGLSFIQLYV